MNKSLLQQAMRDIQTVLRVEGIDLEIGSRKLLKEAVKVIEAAIAQPVQPAQRQRLSDAQAQAVIDGIGMYQGDYSMAVFRSAEKEHGIGAPS